MEKVKLVTVFRDESVDLQKLDKYLQSVEWLAKVLADWQEEAESRLTKTPLEAALEMVEFGEYARLKIDRTWEEEEKVCAFQLLGLGGNKKLCDVAVLPYAKMTVVRTKA